MLSLLFFIFLLYFRFWGTCADHGGLLHRYIHGKVVCCLHTPANLYLAFLPMLSLSNIPTPCCSSPSPPKQTPVCDASLPVSMYSHCSTPAYEWEHAVFGSWSWVSLLRIMVSRFIHVPTKDTNSSFFFWLHGIPWCICATLSLSSLLLMGIWIGSRSLLL